MLDLLPGVYQVWKDKMRRLDGLVVQDNDFSLSFHASGAKGEVFTVIPHHEQTLGDTP